MSALSSTDIKKELGKKIVIESFSDACLTPLGYDLRIGAAYIPDSNMETAVFEEGATVAIEPGRTLQILSEEFVWLSQDIIATVHSRGSFSAKGLILNSTSVDPNWNGKMAFALFNFSNKNVEIKIGERFSTMIFFYCNSPTTMAPKSRAIEGFDTKAFSPYEHSSGYSENKSNYDKKVQDAQIRIVRVLSSIKQKFIFVLRTSRHIRTILWIMLFISIVMLFIEPLGVYNILQVRYGWGEYNFAYVLSNVAIIVSLLSALKKN